MMLKNNISDKFYLVAIVIALQMYGSQAQDAGETMFKTVCAACHTVGGGRLVGPDLSNVHKRREEAWILKFVKSSQTVIKGGDPVAVQLFNDYANVLMPDQPLSETDIKAVLSYIIANSPEETPEGAQASAQTEPAVPVVTIPGDAMTGQLTFVGLNRLTNGGPTCNSCHTVSSDAVMTGGGLAKDLTEAYSRLSGAGIAAILKNPPFPQMAQSYKDKQITDEEIANLTEFLKVTDEQRIYQHSRDYGQILTWGGIPGAITLLIIFYLVWINRKARTVNYKIYDRQLKSS